MKTIKNPVTGKVYKVKEHSSKYDLNKKIGGLWSKDMNDLSNWNEINKEEYKTLDYFDFIVEEAFLKLMDGKPFVKIYTPP